MKKYSSRDTTLRTAYSGMLIATMLVLGYVESLLPAVAGVPGVKLGLSNSVLIFAVYMLDLPTAWVLMILKVLLSGLLFGGFNTVLYAMTGGVSKNAGVVKCLEKRLQSPLAISEHSQLCGAIGAALIGWDSLKTKA